MTTLKDRLLNGKVIGETFRVVDREGLRHLPSDYSYTVTDLNQHLVVIGQDNKEHYFSLHYRLADKWVRLTETEAMMDNQEISDGLPLISKLTKAQPLTVTSEDPISREAAGRQL